MQRFYSKNARPITANQLYRLEQLGVLSRKMPKFSVDATRLIKRLTEEKKRRKS